MGWLVDNAVEREELVQVLREITDLERLISRIVYGTAGARDLVALAAGLDRLPLLQDHLPQQAPSLLARLRAQLDGLPELTGLIARGIVDEPPFSVREGGLIRPGYHPDVDQLRAILTDTKGVIAKLEAARGLVEAKVSPQLLDVYNRTAARSGVAIGVLDGNRCGACRTVIDGGRLIDLRNQAPLGMCPSCKRLLVIA